MALIYIAAVGWGQEMGRGMGTELNERDETEKSLKRLLKTDHFKGHSAVGVMVENKLTHIVHVDS